MSAYNELYLDDAMQNLGDMVDYAVNALHYEPDEFFSWFISTEVAHNFEICNPKYLGGMSGYELVYAVLRKKNMRIDYIEPSINLEKSKEFWAGWVLAYYQWYSGRSFESIVNGGLPLSKIISMYILHEADVTKFAQIADKILKEN